MSKGADRKSWLDGPGLISGTVLSSSQADQDAGDDDARDSGKRDLLRLPDWLADQAEAVLADFEHPHPLGLRIGYLADEWFEDHAVVHVCEPDGHGYGFGVGVQSDLPTLLVQIAEGV